jgi:hypothetical protein
MNAAAQRRTAQDYSPSLHSGTRWHRIGADSWRLSTQNEREPEPDFASSVVNLTANIDDRGQLFCGRAAEKFDCRRGGEKGPLTIYEAIIAGNFAAFLAFMGGLYRAAGYHGHVDVGVAVVGLEGGRSGTLPAHGFSDNPYNAPTYPRTERVAAAELADPQAVARRMLRHLFEATTGQDEFDPFA